MDVAGGSPSAGVPLGFPAVLALLLTGCQPHADRPAVASPESVAVSNTGSPAGEASAEAASGSGHPLSQKYAEAPALDVFEGEATYYSDALAGNKTASGQAYNPGEYSAAHRKLPFGTIVRVVRLDRNAVTFARINDRGPFAGKNRVIDLSRAAAEELDMIRDGVVPVRVEVVARPDSDVASR